MMRLVQGHEVRLPPFLRAAGCPNMEARTARAWGAWGGGPFALLLGRPQRGGVCVRNGWASVLGGRTFPKCLFVAGPGISLEWSSGWETWILVLPSHLF